MRQDFSAEGPSDEEAHQAREHGRYRRCWKRSSDFVFYLNTGVAVCDFVSNDCSRLSSFSDLRLRKAAMHIVDRLKISELGF